MNRSILATRPDHDRTTRYASTWADQVLKIARDKGDAVFDLPKERANRKEVESMLNKKRPDIVFLSGHGDENRVFGQNNETLIDASENSSLLAGKVVYAIACKSGQALGPMSIQSGAKAFIGYKNDFIFMIASEKRTHPLEDETAQLFLEPSNQVIISLLKGQSAQTAHTNSRRAFMRNMQKLMTSETSSRDASMLRYLYWDAYHQVCYGDAVIAET